jgi:hypothetical protein
VPHALSVRSSSKSTAAKGRRRLDKRARGGSIRKKDIGGSVEREPIGPSNDYEWGSDYRDMSHVKSNDAPPQSEWGPDSSGLEFGQEQRGPTAAAATAIMKPFLVAEFEEFKLRHLICFGGDGGEGGDGGGGEGGGDFVGDGEGDFGNTGDFFGDNTSNSEFFGTSDPSDPSNAANIAENAGSPFATGDPFSEGTSGVAFGQAGVGEQGFGTGTFSTDPGGFFTGAPGGLDSWASNLSADPSANFYSINDFNPALANSYAYDTPTTGVYGVNNGFGYNGGPFSAGFNTYAGGPDNSYFGGGPGSMGYGGFGLNSLAGSVTGFNGAIGGRGGIGDLGLQGPGIAAPAGLLGLLGISPARGG